MHILLVEYELQLPSCHSLKDKRSVLKSAMHKLRTGWNLSVAEVDRQDAWQRATLAIVALSVLKDHLEQLDRDVTRTLELSGEIRVGEIRREWL